MTIYLIGAILFAVAGTCLWRLSRGRKRTLKVLVRIGALCILSVAPVLLLGFLFTGAMCGRYDFPSVRAQDGHWVAGVSEVDCGAIDSFHSFVEVWSSRHTLLNPFSSRLLGTTVFQLGQDPVLVYLEWTEPNVLVIRYPNDSENPEEFFCRSRWNNVQIKCIPYKPHYPYSVVNRPKPKRWFEWF
jgi:hypothetical protein